MKILNHTPIFIFLIFFLVDDGQAKKSSRKSLSADEVTWILRRQKSTGSLTMNTHSRGSTAWINPYNINFALTNVLRLNTTSGTLTQVRNYVIWYLNHINKVDKWGVAGTIYDYEANQEDKEVSKNDADSTDAYAATFLTLVNTFLEASGQRSFIRDRLSSLKTVANAIWSTYDPNIGLTYAKPDYKIAYLMDNVEVWRGLEDFANLLGNLNDPDAEHYQYRTDLIRSGIESKLWNPQRNEYQIAYENPPRVVDWTKFYPDASANMWPQLFRLPEAMRSQRRGDLYKKFENPHLDNWSQLKIGDFPFCAIGEVVKLNERADRAREILNRFVQAVTNKFYPGREWPWHIAESSWFSIILSDNN